MNDWLRSPPPILLFTGKGGVGKTSLACASSIALSDAGKKVLLVSTDPASNLDEVLDTLLTGEPCPVQDAPGLFALNIDPMAAAASYRDRMVEPLRGILPEEALRRLRDPESARVIMVSRPESGSLREAERAARELAAEKILGLHLLVNGVFESDGSDDPLAVSWAARAENALARLPEGLRDLPMHTRPYTPGGLLGAESLRRFLRGETLLDAEGDLSDLPDHECLADLVGDLALKGLPVHLSTTDPAAHVAEALGEGLPNLTVDRIDPREVTRKHIEQVMAEAGSKLDAQGRALLEEELRSPCTEEVAVFQAFARTVARGGEEFVVLDTAPTGHTLLLLDASEAYHREVLRDQGELPDEVKTLLPKLRDPGFRAC